jgi:2-polyprenyl-6-methoxyphenol hydroxylase-like FAD-dependent oxidoreductase
MKQVDVVIIGGSLGGLMVANCLLRAGFDVLVLEKSPVMLDGRGAGIVTHSALFEVLERCGVVVDENLGVKVKTRVVLAADGSQSETQAYEQVLTSWGRLYHLLVQALPTDRYILNSGITRVESFDTHALVHAHDGSTYRAKVAIAADGIRSAIRAQFAPQITPDYAGYVAWRGVCDEASLSAKTLNTLFGSFGFGLPDNEQILGYPVAGSGNNTSVGKRCYNFVWYRPAKGDVLRALMTDADGIEYSSDNGGGIPPNKIDWKVLAQVRQTAARLLAPQFAEVLQKTAQPFLQPIFDLASDQIAFGRVALMGDAAFVARPHVGMGVTKAAEDAAALTDAMISLGASPQALQMYEKKRLAPALAVVERGRMLGAYMSNAGTIRSALNVMNETAVDLALHAT